MYTKMDTPNHKREQWSLRIYSGSISFMRWLADAIEFSLRVKGRIYKNRGRRGRDCILKYGKMAAREILKRCYYDGCIGLERKRLLAQECAGSYRGWSKSFTVNRLFYCRDVGTGRQ